MSEMFRIDNTRPFTCCLILKKDFLKDFSFKQFYWYIKLLQSSTIFKQRNNYKLSCDQNFSMKIFTTPILEKIIATLPIVTTEKLELTFFAIL